MNIHAPAAAASGASVCARALAAPSEERSGAERAACAASLIIIQCCTWNSIWRQFSGGEHDVMKVESAVVDTTQLMMRVIGWIEKLQWRLDPV